MSGAWGDDCDLDHYDAEQCDHDDFEADWEGRATCQRCGHCWHLTEEQMKRMAEAYDAYHQQQEDPKQ